MWHDSYLAELYFFVTERNIGLLSVVHWRRICSLIGILDCFVLLVGDDFTSATLFRSTRPTKDTISTLHCKLLPVVFMRIIRSVCPGDVPGLSTLEIRICSLKRFAAIQEFCHRRKNSCKSPPFPFLHSTGRAFVWNSSFLFLNLFFEYPPHGTLLYRTQLCSASGSSFLIFPFINVCAKAVSMVFFTNCI